MPQPELLEKVLALLEENHIEYMVSGSIVSSIQGEPRATHDVDIVVNLNVSAIPSLTHAFQPPRYYLSDTSIEEAIHHKSMLTCWTQPRATKLISGFSLMKHLINRGLEEKLSRTYLDKNESFCPGGYYTDEAEMGKFIRGSEKQFTDALRVFEVQYDTLDFSFLEKWISYLDVSKLYERLKDQAEPVR